VGRLSDCFAEAVAKVGGERRHGALAGQPLNFEFAGGPLCRTLMEFLVGSAAGRTPPVLSVKVWDSASTGVKPPSPPPGALLSRGLARWDSGRLTLAYCAASGTLQVFDAESTAAHCWVRHPESMPGWERAAPFRKLLAWWAESAGAVLAHAAVVGNPARGVVLAGASGAGKSTTALACVGAGLGFASDDCALLSLEAEAPVAHAVYRTAKVDKALLARRFPSLQALETDLHHDRGKAILAFRERDPRLLARTAIGAVVVQTIAREPRSRLVPASPARTLQALAPSTLLQCPGTGQRALNLLGKLVARVPCYVLEAGSDLDAVAARLGELVA
jgi:hypothetical protein